MRINSKIKNEPTDRSLVKFWIRLKTKVRCPKHTFSVFVLSKNVIYVRIEIVRSIQNLCASNCKMWDITHYLPCCIFANMCYTMISKLICSKTTNWHIIQAVAQHSSTLFFCTIENQKITNKRHIVNWIGAFIEYISRLII